ncbi:ABC transporter substrate-binding protein [Cellulomonas carbonis]|uniref:Polyamine ABC transporter substrate-binding protein n=1 Tax=Cellulomonas carbonis T26 TaxID=947969 RepID=A0A0A0BSC0_9CELL|nr:spermidine/putrescine ABC transporter substrate-binding protein [Cellulomonas carbonis]KGM11338.1 polyamine ABC transporter substrate-binding protein [Cellulomonas carbonis T26]GGB97767.1 ABC transporter substrate-binding protein [Cellulomonas carbonis]
MPKPPEPTDPFLRALVRAQRASLSRRSVLAAGAGAASVSALLAACGTSGTPSSPGTAGPAEDVSDEDKRVTWANWTLYLDYDDESGTYPTLEAFTEQTGIEVTYVEDIDDNDSYYGRVQGQLANGQDIGQDIVTLTDWMAGRMIRQGYTQELDKANIPNWENLLPGLRDVSFDPGREHSLTWQSGFGGLAWNKTAVAAGLRTVSDLWNPDLRGRVEVLSEMRDTVGLIMLDQGVDIASDEWGDDEFFAALEVLDQQITSGQIRQVRGNSYAEDLVSGDALAVIGWSGDITVLNFENGDNWEFVLPEAGGTLWSDNLMVPIGSRRKKNAETLMDYYYDPAVAAEVAAYVNYICPVEGAREEMEAIDPELAENPLIFPDDEVLARSYVFRALTPDEENRYNAEFQSVIGN